MIINETGETNVNLTADENIGTGQSISFSELDSNTGNPRLSESSKAEKSDLDTIEKPESNEKVDISAQKSPEAPKNGKKVLFSNGESTGELDPEIKLKHKVDGKEVEWTLQELLNDKAGHEGHDKRFQALSAEKATFKKERDVIEKYISGFQEIARKGDSMGAMEYLAQMAGISPLEFKKNLRSQVMPEFEKWQQLSDEAKKFKEIEEENSYFKQQRETETQRIQSQKAQQELDSKLRSIQETHGFSDKDLVEAYDVLAEHYKPEQVTLDLVTEFMKERNAVVKAETLLTQVDTELLQNEKVLDSITDMVIRGRHTDDELLDLISSTYAKKSSKKKPSPGIVQQSIDKKPEQTTKKQALTWADLD